MTLRETALPGVVVVDLNPIEDDRGFFARTFSSDEFRARGLNPAVVQTNLSLNHKAGTVRGIHFQLPPACEAKLVRCIRGAIFDVAVDLRPESQTYLRWIATELTADNRRAVYIAEGFGHGFQTLADDSEVYYQVSHTYVPTLASGVRYDDPAIGIQWPLGATVISDRDRAWPLLVAPAGRAGRGAR
jgi:dTDP-4-dehydrorhamnose 3,5-epimerase